MGCCNHLTTGLVTGAPNPMMHVNFVKGMVLGADDYRQEFAYLSNGYQWAIRELIGYGTASGLAVKIEDDGSNGPRIQVSPGAAVPPSGRMICVGAPQCGWINDWLAKPEVAKELANRLTEGSPPASPPDIGRIDAYLTLCFRDCAVLPVPIPGEPCRSDDELMTPSRIADDYVLSLQFDPPEQSEADAIAQLVAWIDTVELVDQVSPPAAPADEEKSWAEALRQLFGTTGEGEPDLASPPLASSPPSSPPEPLIVAEDRYDDFLKHAFRIWVTEIRPTVMARRCGTPADDADDCLLLARLGIPVLREGNEADRGWQVDGGKDDIEVDESRRPLIAPLHLVQTVLGMAVGADEELGSPPQGEPGPEGPQGVAATVTIGAVSTLPPGTLATVTNVGTNSAAVLDFGIPQGQPGDTTTGSAATVAVGTVTALPAGSQPTVGNSGSSSAAVLDFGIPRGIDGSNGSDATIAIGSVTALAPGTPPTVGNSGTPSAAVLDFGLPRGADGAAGASATVAVGNVASLPPGSQPTVNNVGTPSAAILDFGIPQGQPGPGSGSVPLPMRLMPIFVDQDPTTNPIFEIPPDKDIDAIIVEKPELTVVLPRAAQAGEGRVYFIRCMSRVTTLKARGHDSIFGNTTLKEGAAEMLMSDGRTRWIGMADHLPKQQG